MEKIAAALARDGYTGLVSVIPPDGQLSARSQIRPDQRGKVPGLLGPHGWHGYRWSSDPPEDLVERIDTSGANIGLRGGKYPAIDVDTEDERLTFITAKAARAILGPAPVRRSRPPRRLFLYRTATPIPYRSLQVRFEDRVHTIELLGAGRQYVIHGQHPSGTRYGWTGFRPANELTEIDPEGVDRFFDVLVAAFEQAGAEVIHKPQSGQVDRLMPERVPEGQRHNLLVSVAGTLRHRNLSLDAATAALRTENQVRCQPPLPEEEVVNIARSVYDRYAPGAAAPRPETIFQPDPAAAVTPTPDAGEAENRETEPESETEKEPPRLTVTRYRDGLKQPKPPERWLVDRMIPAHGIGLLVAKPKVGKSTLARALAVSVATGRPFLGRDVMTGPVGYVLFAGEGRPYDVYDEWRRLGAPEDAPLYVLDGTRAFVERDQSLLDIAQFRANVRPALVVVDTLQHIAKLREINSYGEVHAKLAPIHQLAKDAPILLLHHTPKLSSADPTDAALGSTAIAAASEVILALRRAKDDLTVREMRGVSRYSDEHMPVGVIELDPATGWPNLHTSHNSVRARLEDAILAVVREEGSIPRNVLFARIGAGRDTAKRAACETLEHMGLLRKVEGTGVAGRPLMYTVPAMDLKGDEL